ncbi:MAG TPA: lysophospholipid acyltransferase family protein [Candidatus Limnocylindrales bacterium]|nr:lysophospholipid acyltransferase family protein [Candidatus Limnocylindrales bacterium]
MSPDRVGGVRYAPHRRATPGGWARRVARRLGERVVVLAYRAGSAALARIPLAVSIPAARLVFLAAYAGLPGKRRIVHHNAVHVLGLAPDDPRVARHARRVFGAYARYVVELMRLPSRPPDEPASLVRAEGPRGIASFADLRARLEAEGRGLICVSGHIGNIETLAAAFGARGWPAYALADDSAYPELYALLAEQRRRWGVEVVAWRNLREIYRALRKPAILGLLVDWGYRASDVPVRLFGRWTTLPAGPALLAARTGAPIVPVGTWRVSGGFEAEHFEAIEVADASEASIASASQAVADAFERIIQRDPVGWYVFKPMWPWTEEESGVLAARWATITGQPVETKRLDEGGREAVPLGEQRTLATDR